MSQQPDKPTTHRRKAVFSFVLYVLLLASSVFAAWQVNIWWNSRSARTSCGVSSPQRGHLPMKEKESATQAVDPMGLLGESSDLGGLRKMDSDPLELPPPQGASRRYCFAGIAYGERRHLASYDYAGTIQSAADHYSRLMEGRGFQKRVDRSQEGLSRQFVFSKDRIKVTLALRKKDTQADLVSILLAVWQPAAGSDGRAQGDQ